MLSLNVMQLVQINTYSQENMKKKSVKGFVIQYIMQPFKGQLISKGLFDVIVSTKKRRSDQKNQGTFYHLVGAI